MDNMSDLTQKDEAFKEDSKETHSINPLQSDESIIDPEKVNEIPQDQALSKVSDKPQNKENPVQEADLPAYKSRKQFSKEELSDVKRVFAEKIHRGERILLKEAKAALEKGDLPCCANKTPKQIEDRVAVFIRTAQRLEGKKTAKM
ncbi:unnamed protein product [Clavelina lepadiformis]